MGDVVKREDAPSREAPGRKPQRLVPSSSLSPLAKGVEDGQGQEWCRS